MAGHRYTSRSLSLNCGDFSPQDSPVKEEHRSPHLPGKCRRMKIIACGDSHSFSRRKHSAERGCLPGRHLLRCECLLVGAEPHALSIKFLQSIHRFHIVLVNIMPESLPEV